MQRIREIASLVTDTDVPVLISGESGVGKEVVARFIHTRSTRRNQPFVKVNCAALPDDLLESELFGYERGAFTGAVHNKPGKFELANKGTLLLDEIGEMSSRLQAKLLHLLQDGEFTRLGGTSPMRVEVRVLAATNKNLETAVSEGDFREDLFFRLNVVRIEVPPLRERREDLPMLCRFFLEKYRAKYSPDPIQLPHELTEAFDRYDWPGNVRQLENLIRRFLVLRDPELVLADLRQPATSAEADGGKKLSLRELSAVAAEKTERDVILRALEETNWNRKLAARKLNICYKSLLNKLHRWGDPRPLFAVYRPKRSCARRRPNERAFPLSEAIVESLHCNPLHRPGVHTLVHWLIGGYCGVRSRFTVSGGSPADPIGLCKLSDFRQQLFRCKRLLQESRFGQGFYLVV